jgi:hypothetical protein
MMRMWSVAIFSMCLGALMVPLLVWQIHRAQPVIVHEHAAAAPVEVPPPVQVIDVAHGVVAMDVPSLLHLAYGEQVVEVDGVAVPDEYEAWRWIVTGATSGTMYRSPTVAMRFVDLRVESLAGVRRRVLLLLH